MKNLIEDWALVVLIFLKLNGATDDLTRGFKRKNFWVMETQPRHVNWGPVNDDFGKSEVRAMAWHNIGYGAEAISYWQWLSAFNGQEDYHGALIGADGNPGLLYTELTQIGTEFEKAGPALAGAAPQSEVVILHSYPSFWASTGNAITIATIPSTSWVVTMSPYAISHGQSMWWSRQLRLAGISSSPPRD